MTSQPAPDDWIQNLTGEGPIKASLIYRLSEPTPAYLAKILNLWPTMSVERRRQLMSRLAQTIETDFQVDFSDVALSALRDDDSEVRRFAIETLWTNDSLEIMSSLIAVLESDPSTDVQAAAAEALGRFIALGSGPQLARSASRPAEDALLHVLARAPIRSQLYLHSLSSIAYSERREVDKLISQAAVHEVVDVRATALLSMGRHGDQRWGKYVLKALDDIEPVLRYEAAKASGELGLVEAVPRLAELARDSDKEIRESAIWALGEIGGVEARNTLVDLAEHENDQDLLETIEDAVNMAVIMTGDPTLYVLTGDDDLDLSDPGADDR